MNRLRTIRHILALAGSESATSHRSADGRVKRIIRALPIATVAQASRSYISRLLRGGKLGLGLFACLCFSTVVAHAQASNFDATWLSGLPTSDWNTAANWVPAAGPPIVPTGTASFGVSGTVAITVSSNSSVGMLQFNPVAPAYSFTIGPFHHFTITGGGISNLSTNIPTFNATEAQIIFLSGSAANSVIKINGANISFLGASTAGTATITTNTGGETSFAGTSTGDEARFITNAGGTVDISNLTAGSVMTAGSIEGAGTHNLGANALTAAGTA